MPRQPHTEDDIRHTDNEQDTGNHKVPGTPEAGGADRFGGTRSGAENVEHVDQRPGRENTEALPRSS